MGPRALDFGEAPIDVAGSSDDLGPRAIDVAEPTIDVVPRTDEVIQRAVDVGEATIDVVENSNDLGSCAIDVAEPTIDVETRAIDVGEAAIDVAGTTNNLGKVANNFQRMRITHIGPRGRTWRILVECARPEPSRACNLPSRGRGTTRSTRTCRAWDAGDQARIPRRFSRRTTLGVTFPKNRLRCRQRSRDIAERCEAIVGGVCVQHSGDHSWEKAQFTRTRSELLP